MQKITLTLAVVLLLIILIVIGINISSSQNNQPWPPSIGDCPDYWIDMGTKGSQCVVNANRDNMGTATSPADFSKLQGEGATCNKYNWANYHNVSWDGITYGVPNPCINKSKQP